MAPLIEKTYDLIVIGGGSGGLAAAKEAVSYGAKVAVLDFVEPSPRGSKWGLGGTCVNVGCIPKKLMHVGSLLGDSIKRAEFYGWSIPKGVQHNWEDLRAAVQNKIKSSNWLTRVELRDKKIDYINGRGVIVDPNTVKATVRNEEKFFKSKYILVAVGGRPKYPNVPGALEYGITSDDIFSLEKPPGKTLVIGSGYIGLECAGFLHGYGNDVTVLIRSVPLRGFDQQMANLVVDVMQSRGIKFERQVDLESVEQQENGRFLAKWISNRVDADGDDDGGSGGATKADVFDTVLFAIGRRPLTTAIGLENTQVQLSKEGKILERSAGVGDGATHDSSVFAVGDILEGKPELTPVAIHAGRILARRLFAGSHELMNYANVATTVFTPLEYSCVGLSESEAEKQYGADNIEIFHAFYKPVELAIEGFYEKCYLKVVALRAGAHVSAAAASNGDVEDERVLGLHFFGPEAGEVIQGFAVAMNCNLTMKALKNTVGIHPTVAEEFTRVFITKRSGLDPTPQACCS